MASPLPLPGVLEQVEVGAEQPWSELDQRGRFRSDPGASQGSLETHFGQLFGGRLRVRDEERAGEALREPMPSSAPAAPWPALRLPTVHGLAE